MKKIITLTTLSFLIINSVFSDIELEKPSKSLTNCLSPISHLKENKKWIDSLDSMTIKVSKTGSKIAQEILSVLKIKNHALKDEVDSFLEFEENNPTILEIAHFLHTTIKTNQKTLPTSEKQTLFLSADKFTALTKDELKTLLYLNYPDFPNVNLLYKELIKAQSDLINYLKRNKEYISFIKEHLINNFNLSISQLLEEEFKRRFPENQKMMLAVFSELLLSNDLIKQFFDKIVDLMKGNIPEKNIPYIISLLRLDGGYFGNDYNLRYQMPGEDEFLSIGYHDLEDDFLLWAINNNLSNDDLFYAYPLYLKMRKQLKNIHGEKTKIKIQAQKQTGKELLQEFNDWKKSAFYLPAKFPLQIYKGKEGNLPYSIDIQNKIDKEIQEICKANGILFSDLELKYKQSDNETDLMLFTSDPDFINEASTQVGSMLPGKVTLARIQLTTYNGIPTITSIAPRFFFTHTVTDNLKKYQNAALDILLKITEKRINDILPSESPHKKMMYLPASWQAHNTKLAESTAFNYYYNLPIKSGYKLKTFKEPFVLGDIWKMHYVFEKSLQNIDGKFPEYSEEDENYNKSQLEEKYKPLWDILVNNIKEISKVLLEDSNLTIEVRSGYPEGIFVIINPKDKDMKEKLWEIEMEASTERIQIPAGSIGQIQLSLISANENVAVLFEEIQPSYSYRDIKNTDPDLYQLFDDWENIAKQSILEAAKASNITSIFAKTQKLVKIQNEEITQGMIRRYYNALFRNEFTKKDKVNFRNIFIPSKELENLHHADLQMYNSKKYFHGGEVELWHKDLTQKISLNLSNLISELRFLLKKNISNLAELVFIITNSFERNNIDPEVISKNDKITNAILKKLNQLSPTFSENLDTLFNNSQKKTALKISA